MLLGILVLGAGIARAGGWAVLTLQSWPGEVTAGQPFTIEYALRQHGNHLLGYEAVWTEPLVTAVNTETGEIVNFEVSPAAETGYYTAEITLPQPGTWTWSIDAFGEFEMPPLTAVTGTAVIANTRSPISLTLQKTPSFSWVTGLVGAVMIVVGLYFWFGRRARLAPVLGLLGVAVCLAALLLAPTNKVETAVAETEISPSVEFGEILFVSKGCVSCHQHNAIAYEGVETNIGPNVTSPDVSADFLRLWLQDPAQIRPNTQMPDLELTDAEIEALTAFLLGDTAVTH
jgi:hypothetical protein